MRQAQILLGRVGFDPASILVMGEAELLSHINHLAPADRDDASDGGSTTYRNESRLRRKKQLNKGS